MKVQFKSKRKSTRVFVALLTAAVVIFGVIAIAENTLPFERARKAFRKGNYVVAREAVVEHLYANDRDATGWTLYGDILMAQDKISEAKANYEKALSLDDRTLDAKAGLATTYRLEGNLTKARSLYEEVLRVDSNHVKVNNGMAVLMLVERDYYAALAYAEKAYSLDKGSDVIAANLSLTYHMNLRFQDRDQMYEVAKKLGYDNLDNLKALFSQISPLQTNVDLSSQTYEEILEDHMNNVESRNGRVQGLIDAGVNKH